jgi:DNA-binding ferritin-like protein
MKLDRLLHVLCTLRAAHWAHWTSHWQAQGAPFYGDHLMFSRIYESIEDEIDGLAEKIVGEFGPMAVSPVEQMQRALEIVGAHDHPDPVIRSMGIEDYLQDQLSAVYDQLKQARTISLGLDDFLMSVANSHESHLYLLRQKLRPSPEYGTDAPDR